MANAFMAIFIVTMTLSFYNPHKKRENGKKKRNNLKRIEKTVTSIQQDNVHRHTPITKFQGRDNIYS